MERRDAAAVGVAGVVLGDIDLHFCVAAVARMALGWLRWRAWAGVERRDAAAVGVAGVVLGDIDLHFCVAAVARMALGWLRWRAWAGVERRDAAAVGVTGVALGDIHLRFTWQAWYLVTSTSTFAWPAVGWLLAGAVLGDIDFHFCVAAVARMAVGAAGVALGDIHFRFTWQAWYFVTSTCTFAWQAWHVWQWAGSGGALGSAWNAGTPRLLAWKAWHLETSTFVSRGRRGTW